MLGESRAVVLLLLAEALAGGISASEAPMASSPGTPRSIASIGDVCPTFSWGEVDGARGYELVVYRVGDEGEGTRPVIQQSFAGSVYGWTPPLDRCLERGRRYAWSVRATNPGGASDWSLPNLFEVSSVPTEAEFEAAVAVVRSYLDRTPPEPLSPEEGGGRNREELEHQPATGTPPAAGTVAGNPTASLTVVGEVRTIDSAGEGRVWGRGRPGIDVYPQVISGNYCSNGLSNNFGLGSIVVEWGSAADGCPVGTWVCRADDVVACNTTRPDGGSFDWLDCDGSGIDADADQHRGWLAGRSGTDLNGAAFSENGSFLQQFSCQSLPVWCCWN